MSLIQSLKTYNKSLFTKDFFAGIAVVILLVPQALAYAFLAGFPPVTGIYTAIVALLVYPIFASSKQLSIGPVAITSIILFMGINSLGDVDGANYIRYGLIIGLLSGIMQLLLAILRLGILINFLSNPVIRGFITGAALMIIVNQIPVFFGIFIERSNNTAVDVYRIFAGIKELSIFDSFFGIVSLLVLILAKKFIRKIPGALIVFLFSTLLVYILISLQIPIYVHTIGEVPTGLPSFQLYHFDYSEIIRLLPVSFVIAILSFIDSSAIAKKLSFGQIDQQINPNKELIGLGMAKIVGSFFMCFPSSGSFGRSAVNKEADAQSQVSSWVAAVLLIIILCFLTPIFSYVPKAMLAAIIIYSVAKLVDFKRLFDLFRLDKRDFLAMLICILVTFFSGIQEGVLSGVLLSLFLILWKNKNPHYAIIGRLPNSNIYRNTLRFPNVILDPEVLILRYDEDLYFANSSHFYQQILKELEIKSSSKYLVLDFSSIGHVDSTGFDTLNLLSKNLKSLNIEWHIAGMKGPVRDLFDHYGYEDIIAPENCHMDISQAIASIGK